jgi:hypothetical protein
MKKIEMFNCFSDLHKDVYGVRPHWTKEKFDNTSVEELEEKIKFFEACLQEEPYDPYDWENAENISQDDYEEFIFSVKEEEREQRERIEDEYFESLVKTVKKRRQRVA